MGMTARLKYVPGRFSETKEVGNDELPARQRGN